MKKKLVLIIALLLMVSGCTVSGDSQNEPDTSSDDAYRFSHPFVPLKELEAQINLVELFPQFDISEVTVDSSKYYKFSIKNHTAYILINEGQTSVTVCNDDKSVSFSVMNVFPTAVNAPATLAVADLTNDGVDELIYISSDGGTGSLYSTCHIVDLATLTEYLVDDFKTALESQIEIVPQRLTEEQKILCKITLEGEDPAYGAVPGTQGTALENYQPAPANRSSYVSIAWDSTTAFIQVGVGLTLTNAAPGNYLCMVQGALTFDSQLQCFTAAPPYSVIITDPITGHG